MGEIRNVSDLIPDDHNLNKGTLTGKQLLEQIVKKLGSGRSILIDKYGRIIAGNKAAAAHIDAGIDDMIIVPTDGTKLVAVQRTDLSLDDPEARELAAADNRASEVGLQWDPAEIAFLQGEGVDFSMLFDDTALAQILESGSVPDFDPVDEDMQGRLDERTKCKCPECGHEFVP